MGKGVISLGKDFLFMGQVLIYSNDCVHPYEVTKNSSAIYCAAMRVLEDWDEHYAYAEVFDVVGALVRIDQAR